MLKKYLRPAALTLAGFLPLMANATVESSMESLHSKLLSILPVMSVLGLIFAGFCYLIGSPNARAYMWYAIIGAGIGFGADSIVTFIRSIVH